jgi:hypothetical protein
MSWLKKNPVPSIATDDLEFVRTSLEQLTKFAQQLVDNHKTQGLVKLCSVRIGPAFYPGFGSILLS